MQMYSISHSILLLLSYCVRVAEQGLIAESLIVIAIVTKRVGLHKVIFKTEDHDLFSFLISSLNVK